MKATQSEKLLAAKLLEAIALLTKKVEKYHYNLGLANRLFIRVTDAEDYIGDMNIEDEKHTTEGMLSILTDSVYRPYFAKAVKIEVHVGFHNADFSQEVAK